MDNLTTKFKDAIDRGDRYIMDYLTKRIQSSSKKLGEQMANALPEVNAVVGNVVNDIKNQLKSKFPEIAKMDALQLATNEEFWAKVDKYTDGLKDEKKVNTINGLREDLKSAWDKKTEIESHFSTISDRYKISAMNAALESYNKGDESLAEEQAKKWGYASADAFAKAWKDRDEALVGQVTKQVFIDEASIMAASERYNAELDYLKSAYSLIDDIDPEGSYAEKIENLVKQQALYHNQANKLRDEFGRSEDSPEIKELQESYRDVNKQIQELKLQEQESIRDSLQHDIDMIADNDNTLSRQNELIQEQKTSIEESMKVLEEADQKGTEAYRNLESELQNYNETIDENTQKIYDNAKARIEDKIDDTDFIIDLYGNNNFDYKISYIMENVDNYGDIVRKAVSRQKELNDSFRSGEISANSYKEQLRDCTETVQDGIKGMMQYLEALKDNKLDEIKKQMEDIQDASDNLVDNWKDIIDDLEDEKNKLEDIQDEWEKVVGAVKKTLQDQKEALNDNRDSTTDYWDDMIQKLKDANKETDRNVTLMEKLKGLEEKREQHTSLIYRNGQFVYEANHKDVRDAEYELAETKREFTQEKAIEILEKQRDLALKNIDDQIKAVEKYQEKWDEVFDWYEDKMNEEEAFIKLGQMWKDDVAKQDVATLQYVGSQYEYNQSKIEGYYDKQIKKYQDMVDEQEKQTKKQIKSLEKEQKAVEDTEKSFDDLYVKIVEMFKEGNTTGITTLIKNFASECNKAFGDIDTNILVNKIQEALTGSSSAVNSNLSSNVNTTLTSSEKEEFKKEYLKLLSNWSSEGLDSLREKYDFKFVQNDDNNKDVLEFSDGSQMIFERDRGDAPWRYAGTDSGYLNQTEPTYDDTTENESPKNNPSSKKEDEHISVNKPINKVNTIDEAYNYLSGLGLSDWSDTPFASVQEAYNKYAKGKLNKNNPTVGVIYGSGTAGYTAGVFQYGDGSHISRTKVFQAYAKGTNNAKKGLGIMNEEGGEILVENGTIHNFQGGEQVIPVDESIELISGLQDLIKADLPWAKLQNINIPPQAYTSNMYNNLLRTSNFVNRNVDTNNNVNIDNINMYEVNNGKEMVREMTRAMSGIFNQTNSIRR